MRLCEVFGEPGVTLLEALRLDHQHIDAPCGGRTRCVRCMVKVTEDAAHALDTPAAFEAELVGHKRLADGWRLACRATFLRPQPVAVLVPNARLDIPDFPVRKRRALPAQPQPGLAAEVVVAIDIGTTTVVAVIADRETGDVIARVAEPNRQRAWGADVVARIESTITEPPSLAAMREAIHAQLDAMLSELQRQTGLAELPVVHVCGNTTMLHLFEGANLRGLGSVPFSPVFLDARETAVGPRQLPARLVAGISAFVGADILAGLYACGLDRPVSAPQLLVDIGTNGEMALVTPDRIYVTATAAGPAFEGEMISSGSPAVEGAIDHVWLGDDGTIHYSTIGNAEEHGAATGICGSGLLDLLACLRRKEIVDECGGFADDDNKVFSFGGGLPSLNQADVRNLQLAKGAIAAGVDILCRKAGVRYEEIERLYLAGGFGSTLLPESALDIGLLASALAGKIEVAGNSALDGTILLAAHPELAASVAALRERITVVELAAEPGFQDAFADAMLFPEFEVA